MNSIDRLRPKVDHLDEEWARQTLTAILHNDDRQPARRHRSKWAVALAGTAIAAAAGGGVAFAAGVAPGWATHDVNDISQANGNTSGPIDLVQAADFRTPTGHRFTVWSGTDKAGGTCEASAVDWNSATQTPPDSRIAACWSKGDYPASTFVHDDGTIFYGVSPYPDAASVELHNGDRVVDTLPVDPETQGFGSGVPAASNLDHVTAVFKNATGTVIGTESLTATD
jgi:hypothetical protein